MNSKLNYLFFGSQTEQARDTLLEDLREALADEADCKVKCADLSKLLKQLGVDGEVEDCTVSYSLSTDYKTALDTLSSNLNELADGGWVHAGGGEVNTVNAPPRFVIKFQQITVADDEEEKVQKADIDDLMKEVRDLGMAPDNDLRDELEDKYADRLKEGESAEQALARILETDPESATNWRVCIFDDENREKESWDIDGRTEAEARREAESDPAVQAAHRWTMTPVEIRKENP